MKVTVLDDYQRAFENTGAIKRLGQKAEVAIFTEKLSPEAAIAEAQKAIRLSPHDPELFHFLLDFIFLFNILA